MRPPADLGLPSASCGSEAKYRPVWGCFQVSSKPPQAWVAPRFHAGSTHSNKTKFNFWMHFQTYFTDLKTCAGVFWCFCLAAGVLGLGLSPPLLWRSLSLCRRRACRVVRYSKEKLLTVLQKSSAFISLTIALEYPRNKRKEWNLSKHFQKKQSFLLKCYNTATKMIYKRNPPKILNVMYL